MKVTLSWLKEYYKDNIESIKILVDNSGYLIYIGNKLESQIRIFDNGTLQIIKTWHEMKYHDCADTLYDGLIPTLEEYKILEKLLGLNELIGSGMSPEVRKKKQAEAEYQKLIDTYPDCT